LGVRRWMFGVHRQSLFLRRKHVTRFLTSSSIL
jgi:hypothetical protein